ncbi:MAG: N-acetylglucosaminyldiphosphoundecaprenol N-acetyl-beta-D-mannosaminyltransferase [Hyphomicrobiaceae bacterium]|jgi:N-acetylglucosaminyldiphosphoundecaprenol N-acetyl-beta-D-mannosaminyltransferase
MNNAPNPAELHPAKLPNLVLAGVRLHAISETQCVAHVIQCLEINRGGWIATANLDHMRRLRRSAEFRRVYSGTTVVVADGMPLVWASKLQGTPLPGRVAGSDLIHSLTAGAAAHQRSVFLLGGDPGSAEAAAKQLMKDHPGLRVAGTYCPATGFENDPAQMDELRSAVEKSQPDIVFVALGSPKQELLISRINSTLPQSWWIGVGISFSFVCGAIRRAPPLMQRLGLEWLHRLIQEPRRLGIRYLWHGPPCFCWLVFSGLSGRGAARRVRDARQSIQ